MVDHASMIRSRAKFEDVEVIGNTWYAVICSWYGSDKACAKVNITSLIERLAKEEAERILDERCGDDEECRERIPPDAERQLAAIIERR